MTHTHRTWHLLPLSGATVAELDAATAKLVTYLSNQSQAHLPAVARTLQSGRRHKAQRRVIFCQHSSDALDALATPQSRQVLTAASRPSAPKVTFLFPGLGDQYLNMTAQLYRDEPQFRHWIDRCSELLIQALGLDLRDVIFDLDVLDREPEQPSNGTTPEGKHNLQQLVGRGGVPKELGQLKATAIAQPALFIIEYALAELWRSWGIKPATMVGYSLGEYVVAAQAGVFSLPESLQLVAQRAQLISQLPAGAMLAVSLPEERISPYLNANLSLSAINGPLMCVVAGPVAAIGVLEQRLTADRVACRQIQTTHAFHSYMMTPATVPLQALIETFTPNYPQLPYLSNVTGTWITPQQATDAAYWTAHMCKPVRFADALGTLWARPNNIMLEVGLGQTLGGLALQHPARRTVEQPLILASLPSTQRGGTDFAHLLRALGQLWLAGVEVDWQGFHGDKPAPPMPGLIEEIYG